VTVADRAWEIAEEVLFPGAAAVDAAARVPDGQLDLLAAEGFYGLAAPAAAGGLGVADPAAVGRVIEALASGCLATTVVWLQHHGTVRAVGESPLRAKWYGPLCRGERRSGVVQAALRAGPAAVRARPVDGGYLLSGEAAWVSGWGMVDVLYTAARDADDRVLWVLLDAVAGATLTVEPLRLVAANATRTVVLRFADHFVPASRLVGTAAHEGRQPSTPVALRGNGSLALGVAGRCARLLGSAELAAAVDGAREALDAALTASPDAMAAARAGASALAVRAASALAAGTGAGAVLVGSHAERLVREALFLLVFASRPAIRAALLATLH
jgi:alkylation response protein AidB-like acyl-CoA dehydrogenase